MDWKRWAPRIGVTLFALVLLYPLSGLWAAVGPWKLSDAGSTEAAVRTSLALTALAMVFVVALGTPVALYIVRCSVTERLWWQGVLLISVLLPPLALGILLSLAFGVHTPLGAMLQRLGVQTFNSPVAFVIAQFYVSIGYYVLAAIAALQGVPRALQLQAALLGQPPWQVFWRITFPLARVGLAAALSLAWVRALGEFGAVLIVAYYPAGMPVQLWVGLENFGLPAVMPLLVIFLASALPLPWLIHLFAQRRASTTQHA
ncbi:MAG: ABC transporter permease subunit [Vulcanimicrobiaceae bacterium]